MDIKALTEKLDQHSYEVLRQAIELRKWPDGTVLDKQQIEMGLQAIILWEHKNLEKSEHTGYLKDTCTSKKSLN